MRLKLILFFVLISGCVFSQTGYKIDFKIKGWKDTTVYLGSYYGESTVLMDTADVKANSFSFYGKKALPEGVYYLVLAKNKLFGGYTSKF